MRSSGYTSLLLTSTFDLMHQLICLKFIHCPQHPHFTISLFCSQLCKHSKHSHTSVSASFSRDLVTIRYRHRVTAPMGTPIRLTEEEAESAHMAGRYTPPALHSAQALHSLARSCRNLCPRNERSRPVLQYVRPGCVSQGVRHRAGLEPRLRRGQVPHIDYPSERRSTGVVLETPSLVDSKLRLGNSNSN